MIVIIRGIRKITFSTFWDAEKYRLQNPARDGQNERIFFVRSTPDGKITREPIDPKLLSQTFLAFYNDRSF